MDMQIAAWAATTSTGVLTIAKPAYSKLKNYRSGVKFVKGAKETLAIAPAQLRETGYKQQSTHPLFPDEGAFHPDNLAALNAVLRGHLRRNSNVEPEVLESISDGLLLFGSPTSEGLSRLVFGYEPISGREDRLAKVGLVSHLPFSWDLDKDNIAHSAQRWVSGLESPTMRPNWAVIGPEGKRLFPDLHHDDFLRTDLLLVTKLPNILTDASRGSEHYIVSVGGAHGTGTRAVERLLSDKGVLRIIADELKIDPEVPGTWPEAYQVLLRVGDIKHNARHGSIAEKVDYIDSVRISESSDWWDEWRRRIAGSVAAAASAHGAGKE